MNSDIVEQAYNILSEAQSLAAACTEGERWKLIPKQNGRAAIGTEGVDGKPGYASILHCEFEGSEVHPPAHDGDNTFDHDEAQFIVLLTSPAVVEGLLSLLHSAMSGFDDIDAQNGIEQIAIGIVAGWSKMHPATIPETS